MKEKASVNEGSWQCPACGRKNPNSRATCRVCRYEPTDEMKELAKVIVEDEIRQDELKISDEPSEDIAKIKKQLGFDEGCTSRDGIRLSYSTENGKLKGVRLEISSQESTQESIIGNYRRKAVIDGKIDLEALRIKFKVLKWICKKEKKAKQARDSLKDKVNLQPPDFLFGGPKDFQLEIWKLDKDQVKEIMRTVGRIRGRNDKEEGGE